MTSDSGRTISSWMGTADLPDAPPLSGEARADVCVVGAGITGLTTAYELALRGRSVVVLDGKAVGDGESGRTTGHLSDALDEHYSVLERLHGADGARLAFESHRAAIDRIEAIGRDEGIDCDFERVDGYLFVPPGRPGLDLEEELAACHRAGKSDVSLVERAPMPGFDTGRCLKHPGQGQFHVLKYLRGLVSAIGRRGGGVFGGAHVTSVAGGPPCRVEVRGGSRVEADAVVVATNSPISDRVAIHTKQSPRRTYAVALRAPSGAVPKALFWDTEDPYHYARIQPVRGPDGGIDHDLIVVGGEDHPVGVDRVGEGRFDRLEAWARAHFPDAGEVAYRWSGQVLEPADGLAFIGPDPSGEAGVFVATGDSGHGLTHGTIAGMLLADLVTGASNRWATLYDPSRTTLRAIGSLLAGNLEAAARYADWLTPGDASSPEQIAPGQGKVIREGLKKVAVYRDESGNYVRRSAVCKHLGGIVRWNPVERTWDCPCHGARYDPEGRVIAGPSPVDLDPAD